MAFTAHTITARRDQVCDEYPRCTNGGIKAGADYVRHVTFPGDEANSSNRVVVHRICQRCHTAYRPMPPRRAARKKAQRD